MSQNIFDTILQTSLRFETPTLKRGSNRSPAVGLADLLVYIIRIRKKKKKIEQKKTKELPKQKLSKQIQMENNLVIGTVSWASIFVY